MENHFKVGQRLRAKEDSDYYVTNENAVVKVIDVLDRFNITVEVLNTTEKSKKDRIGNVYDVKSKDFNLCYDKIEKNYDI